MPMASDVNDNDKLMAALAYFLTPLVPIIILLVDTMKVRAYQKYHALNALGYYAAELIFFILLCICVSIITAVTFGFGGLLSCLFFVVLIPRIYYAYLAYSKPAYFEIPVVTNFMKQQGWLKVS
jgi:uncharacterized membrane protein